MTLRKIFFWAHLCVGICSGIVIFSMCATGAMLAFEKQIVNFSERSVHKVVPPPPGALRMDPEALVAKAREVEATEPLSGVTLRADPAEAAVVSFGVETFLFVNPYTGQVLGRTSRVRAFMRLVMDFHRSLAARKKGRTVIGVCNAAFFGLALSGLYLLWTNWRRYSFKQIAAFSPGLKGKARDWNWHNSVGFWCVPFLVIITMTGLVLSYSWAGNLIYIFTGCQPPPPFQGGSSVSAVVQKVAGVNSFFAAAQSQAPNWRMIAVRLPQNGSPNAFAAIEESNSSHPYPRSTLTLNAETSEAVKWEPFDGYSRGHKIHLWIRPIHTGEAGGWLGQAFAGLVSLGGMLLVWTGFALAWRRFRAGASRVRSMNGNETA